MQHKPQFVGPFSYESGSNRIKYRINHEYYYFFHKFNGKHGKRLCICASANNPKNNNIHLKYDMFKFVHGEYKPDAWRLTPTSTDGLEPFL